MTINKGTLVALLMQIAIVGQLINLQEDEINRPQESLDEFTRKFLII